MKGKLSNKYAFWENIYQLGKNLKFELISTGRAKRVINDVCKNFLSGRWEQNIIR